MQEERVIADLLRKGELLLVEQHLAGLKEWNADLLILERLIQVFHAETEHEEAATVFDYSAELDKLVAHFVRLKLLLRRIEFDMPKEKQAEFYAYCRENRVSVYLITSIMLTNIFDRKKVCGELIRFYEKEEGKDSGRAVYFSKTLQYLKEQGDE